MTEHLSPLRWNNATKYFNIHKTVEPVWTGFLNIYEYVEDPPLTVEAVDVFGFYQPPVEESQLSFAVVAGAGLSNKDTMTTRSVRRQTGRLWLNSDLPLVSIVIGECRTRFTAQCRPL